MEGKKVKSWSYQCKGSFGLPVDFEHPFHSWPLNSMENLVFRYMNSHEWLIQTHLLFMTRFQKQFATVPVSAGAPFPYPTRAQPCLRLLFLSAGWGHEAGGREMPGRVTQPHTQNGRETARAKEILVWAQITSCFTSWIKASALEADIIYNAQIVQTPTQSRRPPRNREQVNELCTEFTRKFT